MRTTIRHIVARNTRDTTVNLPPQGPADGGDDGPERWTFDVQLFPDEYLEDADGDTDYAFELCGSDVKLAKRVAKDELKDLLGKDARRVKIVRVYFFEWDSHNISHAAAHFNVEVEGQKWAIEKLKKAWSAAYD